MANTTNKMNSVPKVPKVPTKPAEIVNGLAFGEWLARILARSEKRGSKISKGTRASFAEKSGVSIRQVGNWIKSRKLPPAEKFKTLLSALDSLTRTNPPSAEDRQSLIDAWQQYDLYRSHRRDRLRPLMREHTAQHSRSSLPIKNAATHPARCDVSRISHFAPSVFVGREKEMHILTAVWLSECGADSHPIRIIEFDAFGGEGKSSLVSHWILEYRRRGLPDGCRLFAWSFWSQGSKDQVTAARAFLDAALNFFGEESDAYAGRDDIFKAKALAELVGHKKCLLILDGLEPLQFPPSSPSPGKLKDLGMAAFFAELASNAAGLCIVTSRIQLADLQGVHASTIRNIHLPALSAEEGVQLLKLQRRTFPNGAQLRLHGTEQAFLRLAKNTAGHALSLTLMASYLLLAHKGDVRKSDVIEFRRADEESADGQSFRIMAAYVRWLQKDQQYGSGALSVLRILGLFDRPADKVLIDSLMMAPAIPGVTDALLGLDVERQNILFNRLASAQLVNLVFDNDQESTMIQADTHPLIREYFSDEMRANNATGYRAAHDRLFTRLRELASSATSSLQLDLLYQAVLHGCCAGQRQVAFDHVFWPHISKGKMHYSVSQFGAVNDDLAALAGFFDKRWEEVATDLTAATRAQIQSMCGFRLRTAGRFFEARPLIESALSYYEGMKNWEEAASESGNLTVLCLNAGQLADARAYAERSVKYAKRANNFRLLITGQAALGDVLVQQGRRSHAKALREFREAEKNQKILDKTRPFLHSTKGYRYFELLLDLGKHEEVLERIAVCQKWTTAEYRRLDTGLYLLMKGRALVMRARERHSSRIQMQARTVLDEALVALRASGFQENIVRGLLALIDCCAGKSPENDWQLLRNRLDEAWEIAGRGPMMLFRADILLLRANLFGNVMLSKLNEPYPWGSRYADFVNARKIIRECGYWRRQASLAALSKVATQWEGQAD